MRSDVPSAVETNVAKTRTDPTWLCKIFWTYPLRSTDKAVQTFDGEDYTYRGLTVINCKEDSAKFTLADPDLAVRGLIDAEGISRIRVQLINFYETDGVVRFDGYLDDVDFPQRQVTFGATVQPAGEANFPTEIFTVAEFPYLAAVGTVINFSSVNYELKARR